MYLLLVDHNFITSSDLKEMIEQSPAGTDIVNCFSTETLLKIAERVKPDIVLIDLDMAGDNFENLFKQVRGVSKNAHIIALIAAEYYDDLNKAIETGGVDDYIVKPIQKEDFMARVHIAARRIVPVDKPGVSNEEKAAPVIEAPETDNFAFLKADESVTAEELPQIDDKPITENEFSALFEDDTDTELSTESEKDETVVESSFDDQNLLEPEIEEEKSAAGFAASDFFETEQNEAKPEPVTEDLMPEAGKLAEGNSLFDDSAVFEEEPVKTVEEQGGPEVAGAFADFNLPGDDQKDSTQTAGAFDNLFGEEQTESTGDIFDDDLGSFDQATLTEDSPEGDLGAWDFPEDDLLESVSEQEPAAQDAPKPTLPDFKKDDDLGFVKDPAPAGEQYFEDLFDDEPSAPKRTNIVAQPVVSQPQDDGFDLFDDEEPAAPVTKREVVRQSPFPGDSADDFLFGETDIEDIDQVPDPLKQYVVEKKGSKVRQKNDFDDFEDDFSFVDNEDEDDFAERKKKARDVKKKGRRGSSGNVFSVIGNVVFVFLLLMMATLSFFLIQSRISGGVPQVAGYQMYIVLSGSMNPEFDTGSLAFVKETDPLAIVVGDIITFRSQSGSDSLTTHRVVEVLREDGLQFVTRGDANNVNDPNPVLAENVVGTVTGSIPYLGYVMNFVQTSTGLILLIFVPGVLIILFELGKIVKYMTEGDGSTRKKGKKKYSQAAEDFD
jgi:signal peptidase I